MQTSSITITGRLTTFQTFTTPEVTTYDWITLHITVVVIISMVSNIAISKLHYSYSYSYPVLYKQCWMVIQKSLQAPSPV